MLLIYSQSKLLLQKNHKNTDMKKHYIFLVLIACIGITVTSTAQSGSGDQKKTDVKYRRSSLYTIMLDDAGLINGAVIKDAFLKARIPDKFNDQVLEIRMFDPKKYPLTPEEKVKAHMPKKANAWGQLAVNTGKGIASDVTGGLVDTTAAKELPYVIGKFAVNNNIAKGMVAKWFNRSPDGTFNMNLIGERGSYDATEMQAGIAKQSVRGVAALADAGIELIGNTFVVVTRFNYVKKEAIASATKSAVTTAGSFFSVNGKSVADLANSAVDVMAKGYVVQTTSYLYKLVWNDSVEAVFYQNYWIDNEHPDPAKKAAFDKTTLFTLELIGDESAWADVQSTIYTKKTEEDLIRVATVRAIDAVIAKLEKKYDVFKTKTPLYSMDPLSAKIGLKEGLEGGDKYEVLEQTLDEKTGLTKYVCMGKIKVDKDQILDNRYMAAELPKADNTAGKAMIDRTLFEGSSRKFAPGMLIRQLK